MKYLYLLSSGILISFVHFYLVWHHRNNRKYSLSEHAIIDRKSHLLYFTAHLITELLFLEFSYQFFIAEHHFYTPFYLNIGFAVLDFVQAALPSRGKTEEIHFAAAYVSWLCYLCAGLLALAKLQVSQPYMIIALLLLVPILGMFLYMHINRSKLYPYQLMIVPLFVIYMLVVTIGAH
jgi:4-amino-4-deoxy-L-arabinose transferase-like glycosyltransferase